MWKALRQLLKKQKDHSQIDERYLQIPEKDLNLDLKQKVIELEKLGEAVSEKLQNKYTDAFEIQGKSNLSIQICRDIDGDILSDLTAERCFEKEYRSQIIFTYGATKAYKEDLDCYTIKLWHFYGGYKGTGCGTLFDLNKNDLEIEIEETLLFLLNDKQSEKKKRAAKVFHSSFKCIVFKIPVHFRLVSRVRAPSSTSFSFLYLYW
ncbi:hypothetical protein [Bacillus mojavensis]|uniref:hypothetical protein n=1 Tax=Bacillus mojavensis TaxID=72360 RepID=UPI0039A77D9B